MTANRVQFWFAISASVFCFGAGAFGQAAPTNTAVPLGNAVDITADHLEVQHGKHTAVFEGHVRAAFGKLRLTCASLSLQYNDKGEVDRLVARGKVTVHTDDTEATAGSARLDVKRDRLVLEDNPAITKGPHRLTGSRIEVQLSSGQVDVADAQGTFQLKAGASP